MIKLISPIEELFYVTCNYLDRHYPFVWKHTGLDLKTYTPKHPDGHSPIRAAATGRYVCHGYSGGYGNYIILEHKVGIEKYRTVYAHLKKVNHKPGWSIRYQGDYIGYAGNTGLTLGKHLHFELRLLTLKGWEKIDPMLGFINFKKPKTRKNENI